MTASSLSSNYVQYLFWISLCTRSEMKIQLLSQNEQNAVCEVVRETGHLSNIHDKLVINGGRHGMNHGVGS